MASTNLELVRSICEAWAVGDYSSVEWAHPQIEFAIVDLPTSGNWKGVSGMVEAWRDFLRAWEGHHVDVAEYRELAEERVLMLGAFRARGKASAVDLGDLWPNGANLFHIRNGMVTKLVVYFDQGHALSDLGLAPDGTLRRPSSPHRVGKAAPSCKVSQRPSSGREPRLKLGGVGAPGY